MSRIIFAVIICLLLIGYGVEIDPKLKEVEWAYSVCENNGGVKMITVFTLATPNVKCNNGAVFKSMWEDVKKVDGFGQPNGRWKRDGENF